MKRLNNKGFAISTVLYSILLMLMLFVILIMSIMSSNKKNIKELVEGTEEELLNLENLKFDLAVGSGEKTIPVTGTYRIALLCGDKFSLFYSTLNKNAKVKYANHTDGKPYLYIGGRRQVTCGNSSAKMTLNISSSKLMSIEFIGENTQVNTIKSSSDDVASGNYYITLADGTRILGLDSGNNVKMVNDSAKHVWTISKVSDQYSGDVDSSDKEAGYKVIDINTYKALQIKDVDLPSLDGTVEEQSFITFDTPKKWIFHHIGSSDKYKICNVYDADTSEPDNINKCKSDGYFLTYDSTDGSLKFKRNDNSTNQEFNLYKRY